MKFADNIERKNLSKVFAKFSEKNWENNEESNSLIWEVEKYNVGYDKGNKSPIHLYEIPARALKIGQDIFTKDGEFLTYRSA